MTNDNGELNVTLEMFRKKECTPMFPWDESISMENVSVSDADKKNGSPKPGDMIACNGSDLSDRWLVPKDYFEANYTPASTRPDSRDGLNWNASDTEYDMSIHSNPDHYAWADFFIKTFPNCGADRDTMAGWFANAMMAKHDSIAALSQASESNSLD